MFIKKKSMSEWEKERKAYIEKLDKQNADYYKYFTLSSTKAIDNSFALPDDKELTKEQIAAIDAFWSKYKFAYPKIDYNSFKIFMNRCGKFSVYHCPPGIRPKLFHKYLFDDSYFFAFQHKAYLHKLFVDVKQPKTILRRMNGLFLDESYNKVSTMKQVLNICVKAIENGAELVIKPSGKGGGKGVQFVNIPDRRIILEAIQSQGSSALVIQEALKQSTEMAKFNQGSVNTLRVTTLLHKGDVHVLAALVRVGATGNRVDNWCSGGSLVGINVETGECLDWALRNDNQKMSVLPSGLDLAAKPFKIPNIEGVWKLVKRAHVQIPYIRMVSWDIAIDENDEPVMIENNFAGMIQIHEATTGPVFGKFMEEFLDKCLLERFCLKKANMEYDYREYHDHIVLDKYVGHGITVHVPAEIEGKPVTEIGSNCFVNKKNILKVILPLTVTKISEDAFKDGATSLNVVYAKNK